MDLREGPSGGGESDILVMGGSGGEVQQGLFQVRKNLAGRFCRVKKVRTSGF